MAILPPSTDFTGSSVTEGGFKTAITSMREFLADLLGTDSADKAAARTELEVNGSGTVIQTGLHQRVDKVDCATPIPFDNSLPLIAEGDEVFTKAITTTSTSNKLQFEIQLTVGSIEADNQQAIIALFDENDVCIAVSTTGLPTPGFAYNLSLNYEHAIGAAEAKTFTARLGGSSSSVVMNGRGNGTTSDDRFSTASVSSMRITEVRS